MLVKIDDLGLEDVQVRDVHQVTCVAFGTEYRITQSDNGIEVTIVRTDGHGQMKICPKSPNMVEIR